MRWLAFALLCVSAYSQEIVYRNGTTQPIARTWSATVSFPEGLHRTTNKLAIEVGGERVGAWWHVIGARHRDGTIWHARVDAHLTIDPGETRAVVVVGENDVAEPKWEQGVPFQHGWNGLRAFVAMEDSKGVWHYASLLDRAYALSIKRSGGFLTLRQRISMGGVYWRAWIRSGHQASGFDLHLGVWNDDGTKPPGVTTGKWRLIIAGADVMPTDGRAFGLQVGPGTDPGKRAYVWDFPVPKLCDGQGWMAGFHCSFISTKDAIAKAKQMPFGIMTRDSWLAAELPLTQLPDVPDESWRNSLSAPWGQKRAAWEASPKPFNWHFDNNLEPQISGDQTPFGMFPYHVRALLEVQSQDALWCGNLHALRGLAFRPVFIHGLRFVDAATNRRQSTYTFFDRVHWTSRNRWGRDRQGFNACDTGGTFQGWLGEEAEHFGITPLFWQALIAHQAWSSDLFRERVEISRCFAHTLPVSQGGYFGGFADIGRTEGRWARKVFQGYVLSGEPELANHIRVRGGMIWNIWRASTWQSVAIPYGSQGPRLRPDTCITLPSPFDCPPVLITWQHGFMPGPYARLADKTGWTLGWDIAAEVSSLLALHGWKDVGGVEYSVSKLSALSTGPHAYVWKGQGGPSLAGLTRWGSMTMRDTMHRKEVDARLGDAARQARDRINAGIRRTFPSIDKNKWAAAPLLVPQ